MVEFPKSLLGKVSKYEFSYNQGCQRSRRVWTTPSSTLWDFWDVLCRAELDCMILGSPFQLRILQDSVIAGSCMWTVQCFSAWENCIVREFIWGVSELTDSGVPGEPSDSGWGAHPECPCGDEHSLIPSGAWAHPWIQPWLCCWISEIVRLMSEFCQELFWETKNKMSGEQLELCERNLWGVLCQLTAESNFKRISKWFSLCRSRSEVSSWCSFGWRGASASCWVSGCDLDCVTRVFLQWQLWLNLQKMFP